MALLKTRRASDPRGSELGGLLIIRREEAGLTRSELAARLGVSVETVSACEAGRPPRRSTLLRYLRELPGLSAESLLDEPRTGVPAACASAWASDARVHGFLAECVTVGPDGVHVEGLRSTEADPADEGVRRGLRRAACSARGHELREISAETESLEIDGLRHEWSDAASGLEHRCPARRQAAYELEIPTRRLVLVAEGAGEQVLRVTNPVTGDAEITRSLYPGGRVARDGRLEIVEPIVRLRYALVPAGEAEAVADIEDFGAALSRARARRGFSVRALAASAGLGHASVSRIERGADPTWETLRALLRALPELRPQDVLPGPAPRANWTRGEAWEYAARLHGVRAAASAKLVEIAADGSHRTTIETSGLRPFSGTLRELAVRFPALRAAVNEPPPELRQLLVDEDELSTRTARDEQTGRLLHREVRWPADPESGGLWMQRSFEGAWRFPLDAEAACEGLLPDQDHWWNGASHAPPFPVERLRLELVLPPGYQPQRPRASAWPAGLLPDPERPPLSEEQRPRLIEVRDDDDRVRLVLTVANPVFGLRYGLGWRVVAG